MKMKIAAITGLSMLFSTIAHAQSSAWKFRVSADPLTDEKRYIAATERNNQVALVVGCATEFFYVIAVLGPVDIEMGDYREVAWRVDSDPPVYQTWDNMQSSSGAAVYDGEAVKMAGALKNAVSHIVIRSGRKTYRFDVAGSTDAISKVIEQCPNPILK
jgi:hypothetical protein